MCLTPIVVRKRTVPCGNCAECRQAHRSSWAFRLDYEAFNSPLSLFITLTYDNDHLCFADNDLPVLNYSDLRNYFKKLRKEGYEFKYFAVGEYGEKFGRPHYHVLLFSKKVFTQDYKIREKWEHGESHIKLVDAANIRYCLKDMLKMRGEFDHLEKPFRPQIRVSKGLGFSYLDKTKNFHKQNFYDVPLGLPLEGQPKSLMPRYYRDKIFNRFEKEVQSVVLARNAIERQRKRTHTRHSDIIYYQGVDQKNMIAQKIRHSNKQL